MIIEIDLMVLGKEIIEATFDFIFSGSFVVDSNVLVKVEANEALSCPLRCLFQHDHTALLVLAVKVVEGRSNDG